MLPIKKSLLQSDDGFSLLELLVAIFILSMAAIPMMAGQANSMKQAAVLQEKFLAQIVAENVMLDIRSRQNIPAAGRLSGQMTQAGVQFPWQAVIRRRGNSDLMVVDISVYQGRTFGDVGPSNSRKIVLNFQGFRRAGGL